MHLPKPWAASFSRRNGVKVFTEFQVDTSTALLLSTMQVTLHLYLVVEGEQVGQAGSASPKHVLAGTDPCLSIWWSVLQPSTPLRSGCSPQNHFLIFLLHGYCIFKHPAEWDLPGWPGRLGNDGKWLREHLCQLLQCPWLDPIWPRRLV